MLESEKRTHCYDQILTRQGLDRTLSRIQSCGTCDHLVMRLLSAAIEEIVAEKDK